MKIGQGTTKASLSNTTLSAGMTTLVFSPPGPGNTGSVNVSSTLVDLLPWLLYNWNQGGTGNTSPSAITTFGIYQNNRHIIYFREVY